MLEKLKGQVIVSCQALEQEPLHSSFIMSKMALAAKEGGAAGIRANSVADIQAIKQEVDLPVIGIIKRDYPGSAVYITPTMQEVEELLTTSAEIIALDATKQERPHQERLSDLVARIHQTGRLAMADISTLEEAVAAEQMGFDLISTTLAGYTEYSRKTDTPDFELLQEILQQVKTPVIMEGHTDRPEQVTQALELGSFAVVVGSIITRPQIITQKYVAAAKKFQTE
ncbi:N-acetylmannosamine-6-phosphate 2-epimerase [Enterococcus pallens ATCC BAA-351]|uniref:Putative N-acetylmannosamine-6-phosphate 2-epimerase n=1 Tax=Enterococcus pallens ATCC BAA-351 TaxID=1158607 RepID=R2SHI8_9ENTE|nr:N-acetylmannosamine-6-phosphate 2-epimerase [Enterococcus pallens ATCC BAA-351]EOU14936.1 N-acetylmannosamine-6-phosphate 2-epimerase [Enterococcus pallens ATCC BAA-351]OJG78195.1 N-acetylmannosamine-6-phosphate 2-epimerase [Enterococcus pallens]